MDAVAPGSTRPVSKLPSVLVTVCDWAPMFVQVMVPPTGTTAEKPQVLISEGLSSTIACGMGACCAEATMGSAVRAAVRAAASTKGKVRIGLVVRDIVGRIGIARFRSDRRRPRRRDLLGGFRIVD